MGLDGIGNVRFPSEAFVCVGVLVDAALGMAGTRDKRVSGGVRFARREPRL